MCESTGHSGCELAALRYDFPSWTFTEAVAVEPDGAANAVEAKRNGLSLKITGPKRFEDLRQALVKREHDEHDQ